MAKLFKTTFKLRRGSSEAWDKNNPILAYGEPGFDKDQYIFKIGDGSKNWRDLKPIGAITDEDIDARVEIHNESTVAHNDIRALIQQLSNRLNLLANSDDITLDQMNEIVAYIKNNKSLIDSITTAKVNVSDIINDLVTNVSNKPLSAAQGVKLKELIDSLEKTLENYALKSDIKEAPVQSVNGQTGNVEITVDSIGAQPAGNYALQSDIDNLGKLSKKDIVEKSDFASDVQTSLNKADTALQSYIETDPTVPAWAKEATKPTYTASEVGALPDTTKIPSIEGLASEEYVDDKIAAIPTPDVSGQIEAHNISTNAHANMGWLTSGDEVADSPVPIDADTLGGRSASYFEDKIAEIKNNNTALTCITFEGSPTESTVGAVGMLGMDTLTGDVWKCTAADGGVYGWVKMGGDFGEVVTQNKTVYLTEVGDVGTGYICTEQDVYGMTKFNLNYVCSAFIYIEPDVGTNVNVRGVFAGNAGACFYDKKLMPLLAISPNNPEGYAFAASSKPQTMSFIPPEGTKYIRVTHTKSGYDSSPNDVWVMYTTTIHKTPYVCTEKQELDDSQKEQARNNIDAVSIDDVETLLESRGVVCDYSKYGLPVLKLTGDTSAMTKDNPVDLQYAYGNRAGTASVKWQGSSSLAYPKKNYTIKFDNAFEAAPGWGEQKKYCLKANYIDHSHARNVVSAKLWGQIVKSRASYNGVFDVSKITGLLHQDFTQVYNWSNYMSISEDGIMTLSGTLYNNGYFGFQGANLSKGTYEISFDYIMPTTVEEDPGGALNVTIYGDNGEFSERIVYAPSRNEWVSTTVQLEAKSDNNMLCINMYSYHNNDRPYSVRNLKIIGNNTYTNVTSTLYALPNGGAIDGFPVVITLNGDFHGLYTFNIPKDGWMFGMGQSESEAILCADYSEACWFRAEATLDNDFDLEYVSDENSSDWVANSVNRLIRECMNSDGSNLDTTIAQYLDWESAIDYVIFKALINGIDMGGKNYILGTYDGVKWFFSAYDMDCVYGLDWDGKRFYNTRGMSPIFRDHTIDSLILDYKKEALKTRYTQLRSTIMSVDNVITTFINFIGNIPSPLYEEDVRRWPSIPNSSTNNIAQIIDQYTRNSKYVDEFIEAL